MSKFPKHLFDEPDPDPHTLDNLGPLRPLAGIWENDQGEDVKPTADGAESQRYIERIELQPIDPQTNGPQLFYGMRYHTRIVKPGEVDMYHEQVGFWLWEPATGCILQSLTIPRGQIAMAKGQATADARSFNLTAERGSTENGICSNGFLEENFRTERFSITVTVHDDDTWSYDETTVLMIKGVPEPFMHTDRHTLHRVAQPTPNPMALAARGND